ncbi:MAG: rRNA pseudouridine synthase [Puniceicoccales bacterium]|jgi:23S rRNA pseudouridine2605 synthase|nr:rRNA pseudouridine synthase [Puniceicoccales bacterium]
MAASCSVVIAFIVPFVPQNTKFGVRITPCGVANSPHLALDLSEVCVILNENCGYIFRTLHDPMAMSIKISPISVAKHVQMVFSIVVGGEVMRLQKFLAHCGLCSRRKAEDLIVSSCVTINGEVASVGDSVDIGEDAVRVNGKKIGLGVTPAQSKVPLVLMLNKPKGYVCSHNDKFNEKVIFDLVPRQYCKNRLLFCGRLDKDTTGLILLSDDGEFVQKISHPSSCVKKHYEVVISRPLSGEVKSKFFQGVNDRGEFIKFDKMFPMGRGDLKNMVFEIVLSQGKKNEIHRMFGHFGYFVQKLHRSRVGHLRLRGLSPGTCRRLSEAEIGLLFK